MLKNERHLHGLMWYYWVLAPQNHCEKIHKTQNFPAAGFYVTDWRCEQAFGDRRHQGQGRLAGGRDETEQKCIIFIIQALLFTVDVPVVACLVAVISCRTMDYRPRACSSRSHKASGRACTKNARPAAKKGGSRNETHRSVSRGVWLALVATQVLGSCRGGTWPWPFSSSPCWAGSAAHPPPRGKWSSCFVKFVCTGYRGAWNSSIPCHRQRQHRGNRNETWENLRAT